MSHGGVVAYDSLELGDEVTFHTLIMPRAALLPRFRPVIGDVEVREAGSKGRGVHARRAFDEGKFIFRRRHARIRREHHRRRQA